MGRHRSDPPEERKRTLMRQVSGQVGASYGIGGRKKEGGHAPRQPSLPKMPWDDTVIDKAQLDMPRYRRQFDGD